MKYEELISTANQEITIIGVLQIEDKILKHIKLLQDLFEKKSDTKLTIFYENESDLFVRSLFLDSKFSKTRISFLELKNKVSRIKRLAKSFLYPNDLEKSFNLTNTSRLNLFQLNLNQPINIIKVDNNIYTSIFLLDIPTVTNYTMIEDQLIIEEINQYIEFISNERKGGIYQSTDDDEMIVMYDKEDKPRGIFPRKAFYNTDFQRYSVWIFVFNRSGKLMLHRKGPKAKDNGGLWDKSAGGHVDLSDRSSSDAAERELVEELYLPKAEYTKHVKGSYIDILNLGEWVPIKREEEQVLNLLTRMEIDDWGYFSIKPTVKRTSRRKLRMKEDGEDKIVFKETKFISDIFFFIAPLNEIQNTEALKKLYSDAASERMLIEIREMLDWIDDEKEKGNTENLFTDDLIYIATEYKDMLLQFSDYLKHIFIK